MKRMLSTFLCLAVLAGFAMVSVASAADVGFDPDPIVMSMDGPVDPSPGATALPDKMTIAADEPTDRSDLLDAVDDDAGFNRSEPTGQGVTPRRSGKRLNADLARTVAPRQYRMRV